MKIGYSVEGSTDRAFITGLRDRWCPEAQLEEGLFRGSSKESHRREFDRTCNVLNLKRVDVIVFLLDANGENWREIKSAALARMPVEHLDIIIVGVPDRNIESWICCDIFYISNKLGITLDALNISDPKGVFEAALQITGDDKKEAEIAVLVRNAPFKSWLINHRSFGDFYQDVVKFSQQKGCSIRNER